MSDSLSLTNTAIPGLSGPTAPINTGQGFAGSLLNGITPNAVGNIPPIAPPAGQAPAYQPIAAAPPQALASPYTVTPNQTVAGNIRDIIASGSPLMQQAETNARNLINERGLINSSIGIGAGQAALYTAALPIAQSDAAIYAKAASDTTAAQNAASVTNAQTGSQNLIANLNANTSLRNQQIQSDTTLAIQQNQSNLQASLAKLQSDTTLTSQSRAAAAAAALAESNNASSQTIARIQSDTSLSITGQQTASAQVLAQLNNENTRVVQGMQSASSLANIQATGVVNVQLQELTNNNKTLLQTSSGAASLYNQSLTNLQAIMTNPNLNARQQADALNNGLAQLRDGLGAISSIANNQVAQSNLVFGDPAAQAPAQAAPQAVAGQPPAPPAGLINTPGQQPGYASPSQLPPWAIDPATGQPWVEPPGGFVYPQETPSYGPGG